MLHCYTNFIFSVKVYFTDPVHVSSKNGHHYHTFKELLNWRHAILYLTYRICFLVGSTLQLNPLKYIFIHIHKNILWWIWSTHDWMTAQWTPSGLIACQQYMIIAMQRLDKHLAIHISNNRTYVILTDVINHY
jgi:hypothetical protein